MKVLHLCTADIRGGAAKGAYALHRALLSLGVESRMLVGRKYGSDETVQQAAGAAARLSERLRRGIDGLPLYRYALTGDSFWSVGWLARGIERTVRRMAPDIVHVQWTGGGFLSVEDIARIPVPVVWTLRDMWSFTGGCHYAAGCSRYVAACGCCPQLRSRRPNDLSHAMAERKRSGWARPNLSVVPISNWLAARARASTAMQGARIDVIHNGVDTRCFRPADPAAARRRFGLPADRPLLAFSALNPLRDPRKGFAHLREALGRLPLDARPDLVVIGQDAPASPPEMPVLTHYLGHVEGEEGLASAYSAVDAMAAPSLEEAFGKVHAEAMACGTPVLAYDAGGPAEIVRHRETGYLARPQDIDDLSAGIGWCLSAVAQGPALAEAARARAVREFDTGVIARRYLDHYRANLENSR